MSAISGCPFVFMQAISDRVMPPDAGSKGNEGYDNSSPPDSEDMLRPPWSSVLWRFLHGMLTPSLGSMDNWIVRSLPLQMSLNTTFKSYVLVSSFLFY